MPPALILTAGLGTRLRPLTFVRAKPAVPIGGEPLVRRIIRWLRAAGIADLVLNLHHLPATITSVVGDGSDLGVHVRYSWEHPVVLGSAGGPRRALPLLGARTFLIVNGDTLTDLDVAGLLAAHARADALVTLALVPNREPHKYGGVLLDGGSRVTAFVPRGPAAAGSFHFIGVQAANGAAFDAVIENQPAASIGGVYDALLGGGRIQGFVSEASFHDIGTLADYMATSRAYQQAGSGDAESGIRRIHPRIDPAATVVQSILWDDVEVGPDVVLDECIVADGVSVPAGARYHRSALVATGQGLTATPIGASAQA